jgi:hypothetical protein
MEEDQADAREEQAACIARLTGENSKLSQEVEKCAAKLNEGIHYLYRATFGVA